MPSSVATTVGALLCFGLRFMALWRGWRLPAAASRSHPYACAHSAAATLRPGLTWHYRRG